MRQALDVVAGLLTDGRADALTLPWAHLRYQHTQAVRSRLAERYQPATVNKTLAAVRGVLKGAWRLNLMQADDYHSSLPPRLPLETAHACQGRAGEGVRFHRADAIRRKVPDDRLDAPSGVGLRLESRLAEPPAARDDFLKRIGPNADQLTEEERKKMHGKLAADLQRLVRMIDKHLAEIPPETPSPPRAVPGRARTPRRGRRA